MLKQANTLTSRQVEKRASVLKSFQENMVHAPERDARHVSPCGRYMVLQKSYAHKDKGYWGYTEGVLYDGDEIIGAVKRNYPSLMFSWVTDHPDGHDYLVTSEIYQGQTIIRLDTRERVDYLGAEEVKGWGWIWASVKPSPCKTMLAVEGCVWGDIYTVKVFDFSAPFGTLELLFTSEGGEIRECYWNPDGTLAYEMEYEYNLVLGKPDFEMTSEEWDLMDQLEEDGKPYSEIYEDRITSFVWHRD